MTKIKPLFSINITSYNQSSLLKKAIDSVLAQDFSDYEIIIVDDFSTDDTKEMLKSYSDNPKIKIIFHKKNSSSHSSRKTGVKESSGKYILFLDGDDSLHACALKNAFSLTKEEFDVCECSFLQLPDEKIILPQAYDSSLPRIQFYRKKGSRTAVWNKIYKADVLKEAFLNMEDGYIRTGDDTYESVCIAYYTKKFIQKDFILIDYNEGQGVSFKKNTFQTNLIHSESLHTALSLLSHFFDKVHFEDKELFYKDIENNLSDWFISVIKNNTEEKDIEKSLLLLPRTFSIECLESHFHRVYLFFRIKSKIKKLIKKIFKKNIRKQKQSPE